MHLRLTEFILGFFALFTEQAHENKTISSSVLFLYFRRAKRWNLDPERGLCSHRLSRVHAIIMNNVRRPLHSSRICSWGLENGTFLVIHERFSRIIGGPDDVFSWLYCDPVSAWFRLNVHPYCVNLALSIRNLRLYLEVIAV